VDAGSRPELDAGVGNGGPRPPNPRFLDPLAPSGWLFCPAIEGRAVSSLREGVFFLAPWACSLSFHSVESFSCPACLELCLFSTAWSVFFCPSGARLSGLGRPRGLRPSAPSAATEQGRPAVGTPRCSHETAPATPHRETPTRAPAASGGMAASPEGRREDPPPLMPWAVWHLPRCRQGKGTTTGSSRTGGWWHVRPAGHRSDCAGACGSPTR
jgi:hypothetical protein